MGVTIPLALITLIAGVISLVSNCRSYRKDRTTRWVHYEQASRNKAKPTDYTTKQYLQVSDCQPKRVAENNSPGTPMYPNQFPTTKLTTGWSETQMEREKTLPNFLEDQSEVKRYDDKQTAQNEEQKLRESTPLLVHLSSSLGDTEPPRCPCNCVQNVSSLQTTAMSQLPYIDQTVINTLNLLSSSRASSPPPPYEESERNWDHVIASHSTSWVERKHILQITHPFSNNLWTCQCYQSIYILTGSVVDTRYACTPFEFNLLRLMSCPYLCADEVTTCESNRTLFPWLSVSHPRHWGQHSQHTDTTVGLPKGRL